MAMVDGYVRASTSVQVRGTWSPPGDTSASDPINPIEISQDAATQMSLTFGLTSGKCDLIVCQDRDLDAAGGSDPDLTFDLYTGTDLVDMDWETAAFRHVKYVAVFVVDGGDTAGVAVGGAASDAWPAFFADDTDIALTFPGGVPFAQGSPAGVAVGAMTKNFKIENLGMVAATVRIVVAGTST